MEKSTVLKKCGNEFFFVKLEELTKHLFRKLNYYFGSPPWTQAHQATVYRSFKVEARLNNILANSVFTPISVG